MKFRRRRPRENIDINLVSLIDVVFILLLFFVVTTTFTRETQLRVELPQAVTGTPEENSELKHLDIAISADGIYSLNNQLLPKNDLPSLIQALQKESSGDTTLPLSISADGKTPHQAVITAMDAAGKLGFSRLRMTTVEAPTVN
ncbi:MULTISPECIES: biopolymer transporter ExbD [unclassified Pseudomonas]|uniref:ExbD/TolR family protein n=1 Tax=unclassified Pseudomonas TaxID=196821 RepID=UPI002AC9D6AD|nr:MULTISPECIES: biopolymer transporter ExbD [unclassified Pseudomonas]MEB0041849.1 biopolymer transporter ExbD [Pseudomonas sp. MH10]MEB0079509.1 biopolymer transporter ExbD [Pseudomonas sp. MH10out]MEB0093280.1 biopolymer transporter ExbD [Pseudomonas sp. CCI4.2]MEB0102466.1 biopolymer transporter ExbD [Pseudomonas sp. CCI3.2]MEB0122424.1 biopolymer transporter ExbD [Pseudomonas sp. CCI1.2]